MNRNLRHAKHVGKKFYPDGSVRRYPGNSIICPISSGSKAFSCLSWAQEQLKDKTFSKNYTFLPKDSFHMTVVDLVVDEVRKKEYWSKFLPLSATLAEAESFFKKRLKTIKIPPSFKMKYAGIKSGSFLAVLLKPTDKGSEESLKRFRDAVAAATGVRRPGHNQYTFHVTLAYKILGLDRNGEIELSKVARRINKYLSGNFPPFKTSTPGLYLFNDMFSFKTSLPRTT